MEFLEAKATAVDQEAGTFTAVASAWEADRVDDEIARDGFDATIKAWRGSGKNLPLLWEHGSEAVGFVDPDEMYTDERGLIIGGEVDRETDQGKQAWKMIKNRTAGFSIGFASESRPRKGGGRLITSIDLLEISVTSRPMHPSTRALSWKSAATTGLTEEEEAIVEASRREHQAKREAARKRAALVSAAEADQRLAAARFETAFQELQPPDPEPWFPLQRCPECGRYPTRDGGAWMEVECEQWWCAEHRAGHEDDMEPHVPAVVGLTATGAPVWSERERQRRAEWTKQRDETQQRERELREQHLEAEAEASRQAKERYREEGEISIMGIRCRPDGRIIE